MDFNKSNVLANVSSDLAKIVGCENIDDLLLSVGIYVDDWLQGASVQLAYISKIGECKSLRPRGSNKSRDENVKLCKFDKSELSYLRVQNRNIDGVLVGVLDSNLIVFDDAMAYVFQNENHPFEYITITHDGPGPRFSSDEIDKFISLAKMVDSCLGKVMYLVRSSSINDLDSLLADIEGGDIYEKICDLIEGIAFHDYIFSGIYILNSGRQLMDMKAGSEFLKKYGNKSINCRSSIWSEVVGSESSFVCADYKNTELYADGLVGGIPDKTSLAIIPIKNNLSSMPFGVLIVGVPFYHIFADEEKGFLKSLGNQVSLVIQNINEKKELRMLNELSRLMLKTNILDELFDSAMSYLVEVVAMDVCVVTKSHHEGVEGRECQIIKSTKKELVGESIIAHPTVGSEFCGPGFVSAEDIGWKEYNAIGVDPSYPIAYIPIKRGDSSVYGAILMFNLVRDNEFSQPNYVDNEGKSLTEVGQGFFETLSNLMGAAVESHKLSEDSESNRVKSAVIERTHRSISAHDDLKANLKSILGELIEALGCSYGYICLFNKDSESLRDHFFICHGLNKDNIPDININEHGLISWVCRHRKPYRWPGGEVDTSYRKFVGGIDIESEVIAPLLYGNRVVGLLTLASEEVNFFSGHEVIFINTLAQESSIVIQNKRLSESAVRLGEVRFDDVERKKICNTLCVTASELLEAPVATVWLKKSKGPNEVLELASYTGVNLKSYSAYDMPASGGGVSWGVIRKAEAKVRLNADGGGKVTKVHQEVDNIENPKKGFLRQGFARSHMLKSMISMPLVAGDSVYGVINVYAKRRSSFLPKEIYFLRNLAASSAIALRNAELNETILNRNEQILSTAQMANPGIVALSFVHDARHTMNSINHWLSSLVSLIPESTRNKTNTVRVLEELEHWTTYLKDLFGGFLGYSKSQDPDFRWCSLSDIIDYVGYIYEQRFIRNTPAGVIQWAASYKGDGVKDIKVCWDRRQIEQVFVNVINNSVYAINKKGDKGGRIDVVVRKLRGERIEVLIKDNGIGMNEDVRKKVFEYLFTTKGTQGSGFGLPICERIIRDSHGGNIGVRSEFGKYTSVVIVLPVSCE
ncbi:GAF domain-containing protein [Endothiovibrio diazotrophicus]